jgi:hypothetical protein
MKHMAPLQRDQIFQLRMTAEERSMLGALADRDGLSASDKVRQWIRREYAEAFGAASGAKRPKPKR